MNSRDNNQAPNNREGGLTLPKNLNLNTVVLLAGMAAGFTAQWAIFNERLNNQGVSITELYRRINLDEDRLRLLELVQGQMKQQFDDVIESWRRQHAQAEPAPNK